VPDFASSPASRDARHTPASDVVDVERMCVGCGRRLAIIGSQVTRLRFSLTVLSARRVPDFASSSASRDARHTTAGDVCGVERVGVGFGRRLAIIGSQVTRLRFSLTAGDVCGVEREVTRLRFSLTAGDVCGVERVGVGFGRRLAIIGSQVTRLRFSCAVLFARSASERCDVARRRASRPRRGSREVPVARLHQDRRRPP